MFGLPKTRHTYKTYFSYFFLSLSWGFVSTIVHQLKVCENDARGWDRTRNFKSITLNKILFKRSLISLKKNLRLWTLVEFVSEELLTARKLVLFSFLLTNVLIEIDATGAHNIIYFFANIRLKTFIESKTTYREIKFFLNCLLIQVTSCSHFRVRSRTLASHSRGV